MRASSRRNGKFLLGTCAFRAGALDDAVRWFEEGARDPYTAQGGEGLVCHGDALVRLGRRVEARAVYGLVLERDPESAAVATAKVRLGELDRSAPGAAD